MMLRKLINLNVLRTVKQFEVTNPSNKLYLNCNKLVVLARPTSSISNLKCCITPNATKSLNSTNLLKLQPKMQPNSTQSRTASTSGDHTRLWVIERVVAASLPVLLPAAIIYENPVLEGLLALSVVMHAHWGLEAIIVDYARPIVVGPLLPKLAHFALNVISALTLAGLMVLIYNGPGIGKVVKDGWNLRVTKTEH